MLPYIAYMDPMGKLNGDLHMTDRDFSNRYVELINDGLL